MVKYTGRGLVVKRLGVLSKVQMLNLVLGVGAFSLLPIVAGLCPQSPRAKFLRSFSKRSAKNAAKFWRNFSQIFVLQFPGKMAAKNFTKNPRHFPRCTKLSFFAALTLGASGPFVVGLCTKASVRESKKRVATAGRCYGGPSEKFVEGFVNIREKLKGNN